MYLTGRGVYTHTHPSLQDTLYAHSAYLTGRKCSLTPWPALTKSYATTEDSAAESPQTVQNTQKSPYKTYEIIDGGRPRTAAKYASHTTNGHPSLVYYTAIFRYIHIYIPANLPPIYHTVHAFIHTVHDSGRRVCRYIHGESYVEGYVHIFRYSCTYT